MVRRKLQGVAKDRLAVCLQAQQGTLLDPTPRPDASQPASPLPPTPAHKCSCASWRAPAPAPPAGPAAAARPAPLGSRTACRPAGRGGGGWDGGGLSAGRVQEGAAEEARQASCRGQAARQCPRLRPAGLPAPQHPRARRRGEGSPAPAASSRARQSCPHTRQPHSRGPANGEADRVVHARELRQRSRRRQQALAARLQARPQAAEGKGS